MAGNHMKRIISHLETFTQVSYPGIPGTCHVERTHIRLVRYTHNKKMFNAILFIMANGSTLNVHI